MPAGAFGDAMPAIGYTGTPKLGTQAGFDFLKSPSFTKVGLELYIMLQLKNIKWDTWLSQAARKIREFIRALAVTCIQGR